MTQEKRENFMFTNDTIFYKKLWSLMLPMMLQNLMLALVAVADAFMLGGMDQNYMSAVSLATQIQFIQLPIGKEHPWVNREIREIRLHPGTLIAVIKRGERVVVPKGNTEILPGDTVILGAEGFSDNREILLKEIRITPEHRWCNKQIREAKFYKNTIIVMVKRGDQVIIPSGDTMILDQDLAVVYSQKLPPEAVLS